MKERTITERVSEIQKYLETTGEKQAGIARRSGVSVTVVNQILKEIYKGDYNACLSKIESAIKSQKDKDAMTFKAPSFIQTTIASKMYGALVEAQSISVPRILVLYGNSGIGKTKILTEFVEDNPTCTLIEVSPDFSLGALLQEVAQEIGVHSYGKHHEITKRIISKLKGSNRMLVIDEAEYLTPKSLDILRRIHDKAQIPIVLVGMPHLYHNIKSLRKGFEQIANRMISYDLGIPSKTDHIEIIKSCIPNIEGSVADTLIECSKGTTRTLILLMQDLVNWSSMTGKQITSKDVREFVGSMH